MKEGMHTLILWALVRLYEWNVLVDIFPEIFKALRLVTKIVYTNFPLTIQRTLC